MKEKKEHPPSTSSLKLNAAATLTLTVATYGLMRAGNYRAALRFYPKVGGGGLNFYKEQNNHSKRVFAIEYHPFWVKETNQKEWKFHYHRGENRSEMKKHRPWDGW